MNYKENIKISIKLIFISIVLFSIIYPLAIGGFGQIWKNNAQGDIIKYKGEIVGSRIIGQRFTNAKYFHSRPSSINYDAGQSASANLAPNNPELTERVNNSLTDIADWPGIDGESIPADLVTESGSALDPHISPESAFIQIPRIAEATDIPADRIREIVENNIQPKFMGIFGMERVNVLELNLKIKEELN